MRKGKATLVSLVAALILGGTHPAAAQSPPPLPVDRNELVEVVDRPEEGILELVIGPADLSADGHHVRLPIQLAELPLDGWIHGYDWRLTDGNGRELPDDLLHHVNLIDPDRRELFAPIARRIMAAGRETPAQRLPRVVGYPVEPGTRVLISTMLASPDERDYTDVHLRVQLFYTREEERFIAPREIFPFYLDVMGPVGSKDFAVPPGRTVRAWEGSPAIDGRIIAVGGHLHDYGVSLRLEDVTEGEVIWETEPERGPDGRVVGVESDHLWWRGGVKVFRDHTYRIEVEYENPTDRPAPDGGMGAIGGAILAASSAQWPALDRNDLAYVTELMGTLEAPEQQSHHGGHGGADPGADAHDSGS